MLQFETVLSTSFFFEKENLLFIKIKENLELTVPNVILNNEQIYKVLGEKVTKVLFDIRHLQFTHIPRDVLNYIADSPYGKYQESEAFVISGLGQKLLANFYLKVIKPKVKSKFFTNFQSALQWLEVENTNYINEVFDDDHQSF